MDSNAYGLPGVAALDNPYGIPTTARRPQPGLFVPPLVAPMQAPIRQATMAPMVMPGPQAMPTPLVPQGPLPNNPRRIESQGKVPKSNTLPRTGSIPRVGEGITLAQLTDLQRAAESSGNYQALNRERKGNTASGAYQYTDGTWNNYGGYAKALLAPREVQDRRFAEDVARRVEKYDGDMFKALAEHYLPIQANRPELWRDPATFRAGNRTHTVKSVETYLRRVLKDSPYEAQLDAYLNAL